MKEKSQFPSFIYFSIGFGVSFLALEAEASDQSVNFTCSSDFYFLLFVIVSLSLIPSPSSLSSPTKFESLELAL